MPLQQEFSKSDIVGRETIGFGRSKQEATIELITVVTCGLQFYPYFLPIYILFTFWQIGPLKKNAKLVISSFSQQCIHDYAENYHQMALIINKTQKCDDCQGSSERIMSGFIL